MLQNVYVANSRALLLRFASGISRPMSTRNSMCATCHSPLFPYQCGAWQHAIPEDQAPGMGGLPSAAGVRGPLAFSHGQASWPR